jgi:lipid A ethanolaminephosphotransferase
MGRWKTLKSFTVSLGLAIGLVLVPHGISRLDSSIAHKVEIRSYLLPLATVINAGEFYRKRGTLQIVPLSERRAIEKEFRFEWKPRSERPPVFVLFLGESQRGDRLSLNGFERKTTPGLEKEERLVTYPQVSSCSTRTVFSVPCLLSLSGEEGFSLPVRETSLISVVRSLGFETFWLSMQPNTAIPNCMEAEHCLLERDLIQELEAAGRPVSPHDERLVEALDWVMSKRAVERPTLIVLHGLGSHFGYTERYPRERAEYQVFGKVCSDGFYRCDGEELRNAYDHSLLYFDQVLTQVFQRLEGESAAVLMTSDHGESLGEKGIFAHGKPNFLAPREQRSVPLIFWASEQFSRERSLDSVFEKRIRPESASHDFVFHSVLGCLGVKSDQIRVDRNLCR